MPNTRGGKGYKKGRKNAKDFNRAGTFDPEKHYYALVLKKLGSNQLRVQLSDGKETQISIPGRMMRKIWINKDDYVCCTADEVQWKLFDEEELSDAKQMVSANMKVNDYEGEDDSNVNIGSSATEEVAEGEINFDDI